MEKTLRHRIMVDLINQAGTVSFTELKLHFPKVSEMTLRRDLEYMDKTKKIIRIHGGAKSVDVVIGTDDLFSKRSMRNADAKKQIALKAVELLKPNISVFLDSGTTVTELARVFPDGKYLIFTNSLTCAAELVHLKEAQVCLLGGRLNAASFSVNGTRSIAFLEDMNFDIAFMGVTGYATEKGFTCGAEEEYQLKREVIRHSVRTVVLMDSKKVGYASTFTMARLKDVQTVISDGMLEDTVVRELMQNGVELL
jgi:DeoR family transcriptional regulator, aga operon transcriptional repressor